MKGCWDTGWRRVAMAGLASALLAAAPRVGDNADKRPPAASEFRPEQPAPVTPAPLAQTQVAPVHPSLPPTDGAKQSFTLADLDVAVPGGRLKAAGIEVEGANVTQGELQRLLDPASGEPLPTRLKRLSANRVRIPELTFTHAPDPTAHVSVYREVVLQGLGGGHVARVSVAGGSFSEAAGSSRGTFGGMEAADLDPGLALDLSSSTVAGVGGRLWSSLAIKAVTLSDGPSETVALDGLSIGEVRARAPEGGFPQAFSAAAADVPDSDKAGTRRQLSALLLIMNAVEFGPVELTGLRSQAFDGGNARLGSLRYGQDGNGRDTFRMAAFSAGDSTGRLAVGDVSAEGLEIKKGLNALFTVASEKGFSSVDRDMLSRVVAPAVARLHLGQITFDTHPGPAGSTAAASHDPDVSIGAIDLGSDLGGSLRIGQLAVSGVTVPVRGDGPFGGMADLGYDRLVGAFTATQSYSPSTRELGVKDLAVTAPGIGSLTLNGLVDNIDLEALRGDKDAAVAALLQARFRFLDIAVRDEGLAGRYFAREARRDRRPESEVRRGYASQASLGATLMLGGSPDALTLATALSRFITKPGRLDLHVRPSTGDSVVIGRLIDPNDPAAALKYIKIEAKAE